MIVFAGPSLTAADREQFPSAEWRPPAEAGDLLRLLGRPALRICLIDGYFDHRPAPRHKEILHLLADGAEIWGAASIGALRAAEMASFGLIGIGAIVRAYVDGRITGDDEVALAHGPAEWTWRPLSVPLVDVRATLCRAVREGVIGAEEARALRDAAVSIHYADRTWEAILSVLPVAEGDGEGNRPKGGGGANGHGPAPPPAFSRLPSPSAARTGRTKWFAAWLPTGAISQKRIDALACLSEAAARARIPPARPAAVRTLFLDLLARESAVDLDRPPMHAPAAPPAALVAPR